MRINRVPAKDLCYYHGDTFIPNALQYTWLENEYQDFSKFNLPVKPLSFVYYMLVESAVFPIPFLLKKKGIWGDLIQKACVVSNHHCYDHYEHEDGQIFFGVAEICTDKISNIIQRMYFERNRSALVISNKCIDVHRFMDCFIIKATTVITDVVEIDYTRLLNKARENDMSIILPRSYTDDDTLCEAFTLDLFQY